MGLLEKIENNLNFIAKEKGYKSTIEKVKKELEELKTDNEEKIKQLEERNVKLESTISKLKDEKITVVTNSTFLVDFLKLKAFSIERVINDNKQETVIGYWSKEGNIKEWFLLCSSSTHEKLCDMFKKQVLLKEITYKKIP